MTQQPIIDVHLHCFTGPAHSGQFLRDMEELRRHGVRHLVTMGMINTVLKGEDVWSLIPKSYVTQGDRRFHEADDIVELMRLSDEMVLPLVDTRYLWGEVQGELDRYIAQGFKGIKGIYVPDRDNDLGLRWVPEIFGISLEQYRKREWEVWAFAEAGDFPLLYHIDARRYGDILQALLDDFPRARVNVPHFGIGRKAFGKILDRYPQVMTDFAQLLPHMRKDPAGYRDFIMHYSDRVCFATDALLYQPSLVLEYVQAVRDLRLPDEIENLVFHVNPCKFLGSALPGA